MSRDDYVNHMAADALAQQGVMSSAKIIPEMQNEHPFLYVERFKSLCLEYTENVNSFLFFSEIE